jgi:hypothetical protein
MSKENDGILDERVSSDQVSSSTKVAEEARRELKKGKGVN